MSASKETRKIYPFDFEFSIQFVLDGTKVRVIHQITNPGNSDLYFSLGGHPGFKCPIHPEENYEDCFLEFEYPENSSTLLSQDNGTISDRTAPVFHDTNILPLKHELFSKDALIFNDLKSKKITLRSKKSKEAVSVTFEGFPYMGIWAKTNGDFICIEPWCGIADRWDTDQRIEHKEGIIKLAAGGVFEATYVVEIHE
jgi:galactose mutarotase-like enzyme